MGIFNTEALAPLLEQWRKLSGFEQHDVFNILTLFPIVLMVSVGFVDEPIRLAVLWTALLYTAVDTAWVTSNPTCVKDWKAIVLHHVLTALAIIIPLLQPAYELWGIYALAAEINTWLLILKRNVTWKPMRNLLEVVFYVSWVVIRLVLMPYVLFLASAEAKRLIEDGQLTHPMVLSPIFMSALVIMQFWWSWLLIRKYFIRPRYNRVPD